ncbi:UbiX family flavin prenyltransferase [Hydrogenimonas urashimensis]|uniref:UbiX family flavin prenyltransferase n=1 Tax=Hydrogenimonas urashimensis TaxID=2740515 RepID=UPI0019156236|nr:UbiX family flavin prenyltransferase [Hydrogenimonas urashimensis]
MKLTVAVTGASGVQLGFRLLEYLPAHVSPYLIVTDNGRKVIEHESVRIYQNDDISAPMASGSFRIDAMIVTPCSMNTLAKIACGIADNLVTRAAAVMIKERKPLLLAPREMPFSAIALENMLKLSRLGVIVAPPIAGYYSDHETVEEMERFIVGKWFDLLGIENTLFKRWKNEEA